MARFVWDHLPGAALALLADPGLSDIRLSALNQNLCLLRVENVARPAQPVRVNSTRDIP